MICSNLEEVRANIDKIDDENILIKINFSVNNVATAKSTKKLKN